MLTNQDLQVKMEKFFQIDNYFDLMEAIAEFDKEYKDSSFYKKTKKPLLVVVRESYLFYNLNFNCIFQKLQNLINKLDLTNLMEVIEKISEMYENENTDIMATINSIKEIFSDQATATTTTTTTIH